MVCVCVFVSGCDSYDNHVTVQQVAGVKAKRVFAGADTSFAITGTWRVISMHVVECYHISSRMQST